MGAVGGGEATWIARLCVPAALFAALVASGLGCDQASAVTQPIPFSHKIHVIGNEMECVECHRSVEVSAAAGRPGVHVCGDCHDTALGHSEHEEVVVGHVERGEEIPWQRLYRASPTVHFSHARHVTAGEIQCQTCHGPMQEQKTPPEAPLIALAMDDCIACHREHGVRDDCNACHR